MVLFDGYRTVLGCKRFYISIHGFFTYLPSVQRPVGQVDVQMYNSLVVPVGTGQVKLLAVCLITVIFTIGVGCKLYLVVLKQDISFSSMYR